MRELDEASLRVPGQTIVIQGMLFPCIPVGGLPCRDGLKVQSRSCVASRSAFSAEHRSHSVLRGFASCSSLAAPLACCAKSVQWSTCRIERKCITSAGCCTMLFA